MVEVFGLTVNMKLVPENIKQVVKTVKDSLKNIPAGISAQVSNVAAGVSQGAFGGAKAGNAAGGIAKNLGGMLGKLGIIAGAGLAIGEGVKRIVSTLAKASPFLKGIFDLFGRSIQLFLRPFGDFLATILKPLALVLLKAAAKWLQFTRTPGGKEAIAGAFKGPQKNIADIINNLIKEGFSKIDWAGIGTFIRDTIVSSWKILTDVGSWIFDNVIVPGWETLKDIGSWIKENIIIPGWEFLRDIGQKIWETILKPAWEFLEGVGEKIWDDILKPAWDFLGDVGERIWDDILKPAFNALSDVGSKIWDIIRVALNKIPFVNLPAPTGFGGGSFVGAGGVSGSFQSGSNFVPETGLFQLHKGEKVLTPSRAQQSERGKTIVLSPTFNFPGATISRELDLDSLMRRANRQIELSLRRVG